MVMESLGDFVRRHHIMNRTLDDLLALQGCSGGSRGFCARTFFIAAPATALIGSILFGNFLVIVAVFTQPELSRGKHNWYVVSLAVADMLVGASVMPFTLCYEIYGFWPFGDIWCDIWLALDVLFVTASILNLLIISIDRYMAVSDASLMIRNRAPGRVLFIIAAAWVAALAISLPPLFGWRRPHKHGECSLSTDISYVLYSASGSFYLPLTALLIIYYRIFRITRIRNRSRIEAAKRTRDCLLYRSVQETALTPAKLSSGDKTGTYKNGGKISHGTKVPSLSCHRKQSSLMMFRQSFSFRRMSLSPNRNNRLLSIENGDVINSAARGGSTGSIDGLVDSLCMADKQTELRRQDRRSMLVLGFILSAFIVCWLPFFILYIFQALFGQFQSRAGKIIFTVIFWMGYINSALNPIIYAVLNPQFKKAFKKILGIRSGRILCHRSQRCVN